MAINVVGASMTTALALTLSLSQLASATTHSVTLDIASTVIAPDQFPKLTTTVNGQSPGPLLSANKGDSFKINVNNDLTDPNLDLVTSVHWHGLFQRSTNWADGPAFVTQCPIIPENSFEYDFSVGNQTGTYWYHSHYGLQYCDGLRGPLIIYDPQDPLASFYDVDNASTVITLSDWYHVPAAQVPPPPNNDPITLINGLGRNPTNLSAPLSIVNVQQGKRYRLRVLSLSCEPSWIFSVDNHNLTVIEVEGVEIQPLPADSVLLYAAQRYSVILTADQPINNYWIRALPSQGNTTFIGGQNSAILHYAGAPNTEPTSTYTPPVNTAQETSMHPYIAVPVPGGPAPGQVDTAINMTFGFDMNLEMFTVNGVPFEAPSVPILLQILSGNGNAQDLAPSGSIYEIPHNSGQWPKSVEITMNSLIAFGPHPIHLHGHNFAVVRSAGSSTYNFINPVIRDTVFTGTDASDVTVIRFIADNPGPWFLHCHIDFHLNAGFAAVLAEQVPQIPSTDPAPTEWYNLCPIYNNYTNSSSS